ncbi:phosphate-starvation-inducible PsiE family protein [Phormidium sp. LEGE 05292]|uniref:phosphate-starvation-inducible PsiE family protein n=1 Tax=[Phormidium] sp. LEGE 05292 TaxID=767427 RepID=UPI0018802113|nr:phosphate-starvation-inducible PsiE family protein [Phormidium sp. LEGE 05292]MBE9228237.1 phosphate-starvation-inducible PsiE family protein [Phormidium sp. LEGE 05292]
MGFFRDLAKQVKRMSSDEEFLGFIKVIESLVSKILSLAMVAVILVSVVDLIIYLWEDLFHHPVGFFTTTVIKIFGFFLNILIALELLENITAYLKNHAVQVELVIITSLVAVARKIIILDLDKVDGLELIGLAIAILALSISYLIVRFMNKRSHDEH